MVVGPGAVGMVEAVGACRGEVAGPAGGAVVEESVSYPSSAAGGGMGIRRSIFLLGGWRSEGCVFVCVPYK